MTGSEPTHEWEFKIKDANNGDMRHYIEKIVINLHETFAEPVQGILLFLLFFTCTLIKTFTLLIDVFGLIFILFDVISHT